jgi:TolA-binding protein
MPTKATDDFAGSFHETNARLRFWLDTLAAHSTTESSSASPQQISGLLAELMRAGERLRTLPAVRSAQLQKELDQYRGNVERLRDLLPSIQRALLEHRARLEQERNRLRTAADWAHGSRQTL